MPSKGGARSVDKRRQSDEDSAPIDSADPKMQVSREALVSSTGAISRIIPLAVTPTSCDSYTCVKFLNAEKGFRKGNQNGSAPLIGRCAPRSACYSKSRECPTRIPDKNNVTFFFFPPSFFVD
jgi:hypothetical protein